SSREAGGGGDDAAGVGQAASPETRQKEAPRCGSGGLQVVPACLRGDDPEALALRPSHVLRALVAVSLARPLHPKPGVRLGARWTDYSAAPRISQVPRSSDFETGQFTRFPAQT